jgi:hypothetical protein
MRTDLQTLVFDNYITHGYGGVTQHWVIPLALDLIWIKANPFGINFTLL